MYRQARKQRKMSAKEIRALRNYKIELERIEENRRREKQEQRTL